MTAETGPNKSTKGFLAAIDARLVNGTNGGDSTYWTALLQGFHQIAPDVPLLFVSNAPRPAQVPWSDQWHWEVASAPSNRVWSWFTFPRIAKKLKAKVIHTQYNLSPLAGKRGVTTIHDVSFFVGPQWFSKKDRFLLQKFVPASAKRSAKIITVSNTSRSEIEKYIPAAKGKVEVTPLAAPPWIEPIDRNEAKEYVRTQFNLDQPYLLTVGNQWARKNQSLAVEAAQMLPDSLPHQLALVGKPNLEIDHPRIRQLNFQTGHALSRLYSAADLMVFPSLHEGFGLPLLEAFLCQCPVLCGNRGAMPEVADGAACIADGYEPKLWADEIERLLGDSGNLNAMRSKGAARVSQFSWLRTAQQTLDIYRQVGECEGG